MLISYVLPVYNCEADLAPCLDSLLRQKEKGEIVVYDDGSTDHTKDIISHYKDKIDVLITAPERGGGAKARNEANKYATGQIIAVCDVDLYYNDRCVAIREFFEQNEDKDIFFSGLHLRPNNNYHEKYYQEAYEWDFKSKCPISHPTVAYRKSVIEKVKYPELTKESDLYEFFLLKAHKEGFKFGACQDPLLLKVEGNSVRDAKRAKEIKKREYKKLGIEIE
jgi:glycosyltransferase involved in cell wall biosynthesis